MDNTKKDNLSHTSRSPIFYGREQALLGPGGGFASPAAHSS